MNKVFILFLFILTSCGYQPLYKVNKEINNLKIQDINFIGDKKISKKIYSNLPFILIKNDNTLNKISIESNKSTIEASKNSKGQVTSYKTTLKVNFQILNSSDSVINQKYSQKEFSYSTDENKFKLREYQNKIEENLINNVVEDIIIYLNY